MWGEMQSVNQAQESRPCFNLDNVVSGLSLESLLGTNSEYPDGYTYR